jgi:hypothetical protein
MKPGTSEAAMDFRVRQLLGRTMVGRDGVVGRLRDLYVSDRDWSVRHVVVERPGVLRAPKVIVPPGLVRWEEAWRDKGALGVAMGRDELARQPHHATLRPLSRQFEAERSGVGSGEGAHAGAGQHPLVPGLAAYSYPPIPVAATSPRAAGRQVRGAAEATAPEAAADRLAHLRSLRELLGYKLRGRNERLGRIVDFAASDEPLAITHLVVRGFLEDELRVSCSLVLAIDWFKQQVTVSRSRRELLEDQTGRAGSPG